MSDCGGFSLVATEVFKKNGSEECEKNVGAIWDRITDLSKARKRLCVCVCMPEENLHWRTGRGCIDQIFIP